jgi:hypothetical protein
LEAIRATERLAEGEAMVSRDSKVSAVLAVLIAIVILAGIGIGFLWAAGDSRWRDEMKHPKNLQKRGSNGDLKWS